MRFEINEKVLVYQGPLLYDAKISKTFDPLTQKVTYYDEKKKEFVKASPEKKFPDKYLSETVYKVHYNGWNVKWDEWVDTSRILEDNKENKALKENIEFEVREQERLQQEELVRQEKEKERQKELVKRAKLKQKNEPKLKLKTGKVNGALGIAELIDANSNNGNGKHTESPNSLKNSKRKAGPFERTGNVVSETNGNAESKMKRKRMNDISLPAHYDPKTGFTHSEMQLLVPDELKIVLVDDWEMITKNNRLVIVPSEHTVTSVLGDFSTYLTEEFNNDQVELSILMEITESIRLYFDQCVGTFVIYRYERPQYNDFLEKGVGNFSDIYGSIFLLRLLSIFPSILTLNNVDPSTTKITKAYLDIILHWLNIHKEKYLNVEYENQSPWISIMHG